MLPAAFPALAAHTIPGRTGRSRPAIDYLGVLFIALGASGLTLATSWGGIDYPWGSIPIIGLFVASGVALALFVWVELRAAEPILPMRLFRNRVFSIASVLSFVVGFAMLGGLTFLPSYLQYVGGSSATMSGVCTLPMVAGLLLTSLLSGQVIGATGIYRPFPIAGTGITAVGLFLLSSMDEHTPVALQSLYMLILGAGLGLVMQVLTIVVQNTADYRDLGAATSGVTFFRTLGGSFGASIMGTIYANQMAAVFPQTLMQARVPASQIASPAAVHHLPVAARVPVVHAYAVVLHTVFLAAAPVAILGFLLALVLPQVKVRGTAREAARDTGEGFAMPSDPNSDAQLKTMIGRVVRRQRGSAAEVLARSGIDLDVATAWGLLGVHLRAQLLDLPTRQEDIEDQVRVPHGVLASFFDQIVTEGYLVRVNGRLELSDAGRSVVAAISDAWTSWLLENLEWTGDTTALDERVRVAVRGIARQVMVEQQQQLVNDQALA